MARSKDMKGRAASTPKSSGASPGYIWLLAGLAIGLFISFLVYLGQQDLAPETAAKKSKKEIKASQDNSKASANPSNATTEKPAREPRFDFYTILPESETFVPEPDTRKAETKPTDKVNNTGPAPTPGKQYLLQAGSFRNHADADNLKANLALLGVTSSIQSVTVNNESWHRVRIGPFNNDKILRETLATLKGNNIQTMTMELK